MLESLLIKNFRNLKDLQIKSLSRVNLIAGKNNTGKSTVLEALAIYASKGDINVIYNFLEDRGEYFQRNNNGNDSFGSNEKALSSLFTDRITGFEDTNIILIGNLSNSWFDGSRSLNSILSLSFVKYVKEIIKTDNGEELYRMKVVRIDENNNNMITSYGIGLEIKYADISHIIPLKKALFPTFIPVTSNNTVDFQFIKARNIDREVNGNLWDNITLTEKEKYVIEALNIIEPKTERLAFIEESSSIRNAVIKLSNNPSVLPLRSMGDGINRVLTIILALINAENGFLLIDEFENGLHHTVQEQLWTIIFNLAEKLNVQVFATTHSEDCIAGFESVLNDIDNSTSGIMIRLENINGLIKPIEINPQELKIANERNIEIR